MVVHVAGVVVFVAAGVGPKTTPVKAILEIATGGRALWARANVRGLSAEGAVLTSDSLSFLEMGSVGAPRTGKLGVQFGVQFLLLPAKLENGAHGEPLFRKEFSREQTMVPW